MPDGWTADDLPDLSGASRGPGARPAGQGRGDGRPLWEHSEAWTGVAYDL